MADSIVNNPPLPVGADFSASTGSGPSGSGSVPLPTSQDNGPVAAIGNVNTSDTSSGLGGGSGFSLADILNKVAGTNASAQSAIGAITDSYNSLKDAGTAMLQAITQKGQDDTLVAQTQQLGQLRAQENARAVATAFGTNMDDSGQVLTSLGATMLQSYQESQVAAAKLHDINSVSFLDDPLAWISGQFQKGPATSDFNYAATKYNSAEQTLSSLLALTSADTKVQQDIAKTKDAASVQAASDSIAQEGVINAQKTQMQNLLYNVQGVEAVQKMNESQLSNSVQALGAINQGQELQIAQQRAAREGQNADLQRQEIEQRLTIGQMSIDDMTQTATTVNAGRASLGLDPLPPVKIAQLLKMSGSAGQAIKDQYNMGASSAAIGKTIVSDNSGDAARIIANSRAPLTPSQTPIKSLLTDTYAGVASGTLAKNIDIKNPAAVSASTSAFIGSRTQSMAASINPADGTNIYAPPDLQSVASLPAVQSTPLYQQVMLPILEAAKSSGQVTKFDPEVVAGLALAAVQKGTLSFNDAVSGINTFANGAVMTNNTTKDYTKFGIRPQSSLNMKVLNPISGTSMVVNLADKSQVANYLSKTQIGTSNPGLGLNLN